MTRRIRKAPISTPATTIHGTKVETRADIDEEPPRWLPDLELEVGEDMFADSKATMCRKKSNMHESYIFDRLEARQTSSHWNAQAFSTSQSKRCADDVMG